jgi:hypothetical protein
MMEEFDAEEDRRSRLSLVERMAEDGRKLQRQLEREPSITIPLQPSPPRHEANAVPRRGVPYRRCVATIRQSYHG